jgi:acyl-CoA synthetase (AMP-forming)/AMP-acid ligase II
MHVALHSTSTRAQTGDSAMLHPYEDGLAPREANYVPLTPIDFIARAAEVYGDRLAMVHGSVRRNWRDTYARTRRLASALQRAGIGRGDTVAVLLPNIPAMVEAHFGVPMLGAVLNTLNTRLDVATMLFMLRHGEAKALIVDTEYAALAQRAALAFPELKIITVADVAPADPEHFRARSTTRPSSNRAIPSSRGSCPPTNGTPSRSTTPRARRAIRRAWSITIAARI